ncbi:hypothetical protein LZZ85_21105 [Terrimonas sp. NA20]|uniref:Uncharacterized protein n=1 Tax=Terrimonas ginsenosidimutans TaxID=2908004 RepID=A0ABS9KWW1_9BACT|nr:hypothetical protein [Terrimonas ginsenosidimutans]MCG2616811.1 hypothetical protein [Terrimonas ginsenosidimutans]
MISRKKSVLLIVAISFAAFLLMALKPLPRPTLNNCRKQTGVVSTIESGDGKADIVITLQGDDHYYYINRGQERGLSIPCLITKLKNREIEVLTVKHWTPLDPSSNTRHVARIACEGAEVYSEL